MATIKIATTAIHCCYDKQKNLEKCLSYVRQAAVEGCRLIVFPEMVLQGYLNSLVGPVTAETILYQNQNAETVPEGASVQTMIQAARENNIYIVWGMCERDKNVFDTLYNTVVLVGPEGFIGAYRKVHLSMDEKHVFTAGSEYPVFETELGRIGLQNCYDKCFPEASRELALGGAEIMILLSAWTDYIGTTPDHVACRLGSRFDLYDCMRAMENQVWFISSNQFGSCGAGDYCGKSNIVDPNGYILATVGEKEGMGSVTADIRGEILKNRASFLQTELRHLRFDAYHRLMSGKGYDAMLTPLSTNTNNESIERQ